MSEQNLNNISTENQWVNYVPLHCHSYYSLLDGFCSPKDIAQVAKKHHFRAIALTDHGTCAGLYSFNKACGKEEIKPILGMEAYLVDDIDLKEKEEQKLHVTLLAKNKIGYKNLIALSSTAYLKGFYSRPRVDAKLLRKHKDGIICGSACIQGIASHYILKNDIETAKKNLSLFKEIYGDDFYVEIMVHNYKDEKTTKEFKMVMRKMYELSKEFHILAVATCDSHYINKEDSSAHDVLLSISTRNTIKNPKRFSFRSTDFYIKSFEELLAIYKKTPELLTNSLLIADKIDNNIIEARKDLLPDFKLPPGESSETEYLKSLAYDGMKNRGLYEKPEYMSRMKEELDVIVGCGFAKYFLIIWDMISYAKREKIRVGPGRGSGVASLCLYCLEITQLDPIEYDLLFSRFMNKDRITPPDIDLDFDYTKQEQIFNYMKHKYGVECTARIGTYTSLKVRDAIRRVGKVLDIGNDFEDLKGKFSGGWKSGGKTLKIIGDICKSVSDKIMILDNHQEEFDRILDDPKNKNIKRLKKYMSKYEGLFDYARKVTGTLSAAGVHPAGIIVCKDSIVEHVPLRMSKGVICTQYDMKEIDELGLLKFDFLALKTLTLIERCLELIEKRHNKKIDINELKPDSKEVFNILSQGDTDGVFQFEGYGISSLLQNLKVDSFNDMVVANAMYRPGTLSAGIPTNYCDYKHGRKPVSYIHPMMKDILGETYGMMIYQEQVMLVSIKMAGFSITEADTLRKGIGKKEPEKIMKLKDKFIKGCINHGVEKDVAEKIFELCQYFSGYGFNKSHASAYALLAYQTAWLKHFFSIEFMCSLLSSVTSEQQKEKRERYEISLPRYAINLLPHDINFSKNDYTIEKNDIRQPISTIKGIGEATISGIVKGQPYSSLEDFVNKNHGHAINKTVLEALIESGCMRCWGSRDRVVSMISQAKDNMLIRRKREKKMREFDGSLF